MEPLNAGGVGEYDVQRSQPPAVVMPEQRPIQCQSHQWHRNMPQTSWNMRIGQIEHDEIRPPIGRQTSADLGPSFIRADGQVGCSLRIEGQAFASLPLTVEILIREILVNGPEKVTAHGSAPW